MEAGKKKDGERRPSDQRAKPERRATDFDQLPTVRPPPPIPAAKRREAADFPKPPPLPNQRKSTIAAADLSLPPRLAVLLVGSGFPMLEAVQKALESRDVYVETALPGELRQLVVAAAPDLIVLVGDAAADGGQEATRILASSPLSSVVPVALMTDEARLDTRMRAFRHGIAAVVKASASVDAIAAQIAELAAEIPQRAGIERGSAGRTTLNDLVDLLASEVKSGILSVTPGGAGTGGIQLVLGEGRPIARMIDDFVSKLKTQVVAAEPLEYEFDERAPGSVKFLGGDDVTGPANLTDVSGLRVVLADDDAARADAVAQALRRVGVAAAVTDFAPQGARFERLKLLDPAILLVGERQLQAGGVELLRRMRDDMRLRWVSLLIVRWEEVWPSGVVDPSVDSLLAAMAALIEPERAIGTLAKQTPSFDTRLEIIGPARLLRELATIEHPLRISVQNPRIAVVIDLSQGLLVGARAHTYGEASRELEGSEALAALLVLSTGRVHVERTEQASAANVMAPVEIAINQSLSEEPPIPPSRPAASALGAVEAALSMPADKLHAALAEPAHADAEAPHYPSPTPVANGSSADIFGLRRRRSRAPIAIALALLAAVGGATLYWRLGQARRAFSPAARAELDPAAGPASSPAVAAASAPGLIERASNGDARAIAELESRPVDARTPDESLAIARGHAAQKRAELATLARSVARDPRLTNDPQTMASFERYALDPQTSPEALRAIAGLPGTRGADLLYEIWTGTPQRNATTEFAEHLVYSDEVRRKATPALLALLDLRRAKNCAELIGLVPRLARDGDQRAVRPLARLIRQNECGKAGVACFPCVRGNKQLAAAIRAVGKRPGPQ